MVFTVPPWKIGSWVIPIDTVDAKSKSPVENGRWSTSHDFVGVSSIQNCCRISLAHPPPTAWFLMRLICSDWCWRWPHITWWSFGWGGYHLILDGVYRGWCPVMFHITQLGEISFPTDIWRILKVMWCSRSPKRDINPKPWSLNPQTSGAGLACYPGDDGAGGSDFCHVHIQLSGDRRPTAAPNSLRKILLPNSKIHRMMLSQFVFTSEPRPEIFWGHSDMGIVGDHLSSWDLGLVFCCFTHIIEQMFYRWSESFQHIPVVDTNM